MTLVLVVGVGRSGTSLLTGMLGQLGFHVPQPEVKADETNPRGFGEPAWVVGFHRGQLRKRRITVNDSRPEAFASSATAAEDPQVTARLRDWLRPQLRGDTVVKDPRTVWFLPLWERVAAELDTPTAYVTMLRHPAEIVASAKRSYGTWQTDASRTAAWLNVILETEHATRGAKRAFVAYEDLLQDWVRELRRVGGEIGSGRLASVEREPAVEAFVDPSLHRSRVTWDDLDVPPRVRELAEDTWRALRERDERRLDEIRAAYAALYAEAEAIAQSSVTAAKRRPRAAAGGAPPSLRVRVARRVPKRLRRRLRALMARS
jgi:hypothetical protein